MRGMNTKLVELITKRERIIREIINWFEDNAPFADAVIGISGGKDSTIAAALLVRALGRSRVVGVMMPNGEQKDITDAQRVIDLLGIKGKYINIGNTYNALKNELALGETYMTEQAKTNLPPRLRMATLYAVAQSLPREGIVINTCNASEDYIGYSTKFGDSAGDFSVLGNLLVSEVIEIGDTLSELPEDLIHKTPSDGLCGKTDEENFGFTYDDLENYITKGTTGIEIIDKKIKFMHDNSRHKYNPIYTCWKI